MAITRSDDTPDGLELEDQNARSLEAFFEAHYQRLVGLAGLVCGEVASAEDIVQTALERAWRSRDRLEDPARLRPWLDRIVVREAARERRFRLTWLGRRSRPTADESTGRVYPRSRTRLLPPSPTAQRCARPSKP